MLSHVANSRRSFTQLLLLCAICINHVTVVVAAGAKSLKPSGNWAGNDGSWSTFELKIGTPPQLVHVLPSTSISALLAVVPEGCDASSDPQNCTERRGGIFGPQDSSTWIQKAIFQLPIPSEMLWGYAGNGSLGFDKISFPGYGDETLELSNATISAYATKDFFVGQMGLSPLHLVTESNGSWMNSLLMSMKESGQIGSLSWGYTAGSFNDQALGSLTLGGYDPTRFSGSELTVPLQNDPFRDIVVTLQGITSGTQNLLLDSISIFIDSTMGQIWLPEEACLRFEEVFGLSWDSAANLYSVNDTLHESLLRENPSITMTFAVNESSTDVINIDLPYKLFDLTADWPLSSGTPVKYFPLRRTTDASLYVLGRPFFQAAYLTMDYERRVFRLSQAMFPTEETTPNPVAILPLDDASRALDTKTIVGIAVGGIALIGALAGLCFCWRRRKSRKAKTERNSIRSINDGTGLKPELHGSSATPMSQITKAELACSDVKSANVSASELESPGSSERGEKFGYHHRTQARMSELEGDHLHKMSQQQRTRESLMSGISTTAVSAELAASTPLTELDASVSSCAVSRCGQQPIYELPGDCVEARVVADRH